MTDWSSGRVGAADGNTARRGNRVHTGPEHLPLCAHNPWLQPLAERIIADASCPSAVLMLAAWQARQGREADLYALACEASGVGCA